MTSADLTVPPLPDLDRLRALCEGDVEWRVANPETGAYCIAFDREHLAAEWLRDHRERFPEGRFADYQVQRAVVQSELQRATLAALASLQARLEAAERDAARLDHLQAWSERGRALGYKWDAFTFRCTDTSGSVRDQLDGHIAVAHRAAIDAATQKPAAPVEPRWTITAPDGRRFFGESPFRAANAAAADERTRNPPTPEQVAAFEALVQQHEDAMLADHEHLNCPACGGSGHVEDARHGWIAVADRLPEDDARVLCATWFDMTNEQQVEILSFRHGTGLFGSGGEQPTHWRPLPAAPSEGGAG